MCPLLKFILVGFNKVDKGLSFKCKNKFFVLKINEYIFFV
jgi:hypothetical protein